jgi:hypothetical protein
LQAACIERSPLRSVSVSIRVSLSTRLTIQLELGDAAVEAQSRQAAFAAFTLQARLAAGARRAISAGVALLTAFARRPVAAIAPGLSVEAAIALLTALAGCAVTTIST